MARLSTRSYSLDAVKEIPIVQVCEQLAVPVTRRGRNYWCKLRDENIASAILHPDSNTFYDFGTQEHGSNIDLVCRVTGKPFNEAVRYLGDAFSLQPETSAEAQRRLRTMSRADYSRIGLHADLATKNFTFPIGCCTTDKLLDIERRYQMSMNALRKNHPKVYERILREKALPYVERLRNLYYLEVWSHYCYLQAIGRTVFFYDSDRTHAHFASHTHRLEQVERSLLKAVQGTCVDPPPPAVLDPMRVISRFLTDKLSISIGTCSLSELSASAKGSFSQLKLSHDAYFSVQLDDIPHAAILTKDQVVLSCRRQDLSLIKRRVDLHSEHERLSNLDNQIQTAQMQKSEQKEISVQQEPVVSR